MRAYGAFALVFALADCGRSELAPLTMSDADATVDARADSAVDTGLDSLVDSPAEADAPRDIAPDLAPDTRPDSSPVVDTAPETPDTPTCKWAGFAPLVTYVTEHAPRAAAAGDFNGDGALDLAVAAWGPVVDAAIGNGAIAIHVNAGLGTFAPPVTYAADPSAFALVTGDFTGAGGLDLVVANGTSDFDVYVNQGGGGFAPFVAAPAGAIPVAMAAGDVNRDGRLDIVFSSTLGWIGVQFGNGDGTFAAPVTYATGPEPNAIAVGDLNGDGYPDVVVVNTSWGCLPVDSVCPSEVAGWGSVNVLTNQGDGTFAPQVAYPAGIGAASVAIGDFNGDGAPDIAVCNNTDNTLGVLTNVGGGVFGPQVTYANAGGGVVAADFNGDGHTDIAVVQGSLQDATGVMMLFTNAGDGTFAAPTTYAIEGDPGSQIVGDFNGDGLPDIAVSTRNNTIGVILSRCE